VAQSRGAFFINNASVPGTATILDGTSVRTTATSSDVSLKRGERLTLASSSEARIFQDRLELTSGMADVSHMTNYRLETGHFQIAASGPDAHVKVAIDGRKLVHVAAIAGNAEIRNQQGMLVARVLPGTVLQVQNVGGNKVSLRGILQKKGGTYLLTDDTTNVTVELRGSDLSNLVGKKVQISGSIIAGATPVAGATEVVNVAQSSAVAAAAVGAGAAGAGAAGTGAAGAGATTGLSTTAIVLGGTAVAAGGTLGGLAAAGTFSDSSSVSR